MSKVGLAVLILGLVGALLGGGVLLVSLLLPVVTDGRTSWDEALLGIIPGALLLVASLVAALVGLIVMVVAKRRKGAQAG